MQTKHLYVLIHIWTKGEVGALFNRFKPFSKIFLLTVPRLCFFCGSFMLFLSCFVVLSCIGHLLGKGWPLGSHLWCLIVMLSLSHWCPRSGVVLDCIYFWSLPSFLLIDFTLILRQLTLYSTITPFDTYVFGNIMENRAFAPWSNCSIFHDIFKSIQNFT